MIVNPFSWHYNNNQDSWSPKSFYCFQEASTPFYPMANNILTYHCIQVPFLIVSLQISIENEWLSAVICILRSFSICCSWLNEKYDYWTRMTYIISKLQLTFCVRNIFLQANKGNLKYWSLEIYPWNSFVTQSFKNGFNSTNQKLSDVFWF